MSHTQHLSDAALISLYQSGSNAAVETLVMRYKDKMYTAIYILVKDQYLAEDIFQEAFLKIIRTIKSGRYAEQGKFLPWALRVAHNLCMDHFRRVRQQVPVTTEDGREIPDLLPMAHANGGERLEERQTHQSVRQLVESLPEEQREVVTLRIYGELSFKEIADLTNVSINTALGRMRYGLINLRKKISEQKLVLR
jgi:RNA polymerase sigma-70 factor (ECF subfamily)